MASLKGWTMDGEAVFGSYGAGSTSDRTTLESKVSLVRDGKKQSSKLVKGSEGEKTIQFQDVAKGDIIQWKAKTLCDGKPTADRVTVVLTYYDPVYIGKLGEQVMSELSDDELTMVMLGDTKIVEEKVEPLLNTDLAIKQVYSTTVITDKEDGEASGEIPFTQTYPWTEYVLTIHYGYAGLAERSDRDKAVEFWAYDVGLMVFEIALIGAAAVATGGAALAFGLAATAVGVADLGIMASRYTASGFGAIDENRKGCLFPALGYNHTYTFMLDEPIVVEDEEGESVESSQITQTIVEQFSPETLTRLEETKEQYGFGDYSTEAFLGIIGVFGLAALWIILRRPSK